VIRLWEKAYTRLELLRRVGDMSQLAAAQPFELTDGSERGVRGVWMRNAAGLELCVIAERGLGITHLRYRGVPIPFTSATGTVHPSFAEAQGLGWLRSWPGGFLTPCGLSQVGSACIDEGMELGLHGRLSNLPARNLAWGSEWQGEDYVLWVRGSLRETAVFGENILMTRTIGMRLDEPGFWIEDRVENQGFTPTPHMFLQHINLGFPLVDTDTILELPPHNTEPRDETARVGLYQSCEFSVPIAGYREQVFYHDLEPDPQGQVEVRLLNPTFASGRGISFSMRYAKMDYPVLVEWKIMNEGLYVVGLEPANCHVEGRKREREMGTLQSLAPQEVRTYRLDLGFWG
jgi:hypothetical protein